MSFFPGWLQAAALDVRFAIRSWRKSPGLISVAVLTLAVAMGSTTAIFSVVKAILLNQLPYREPDRVVTLGIASSAVPQSAPASFATVDDWRTQSRLIQSISVYGDSQNVIFENGQARVLRGMRVSWDFFDTLGAQVQFGRTFLRDEEFLGHDHEIILTHALWLDLFGGDPNAVGRTLDFPALRSAGQGHWNPTGELSSSAHVESHRVAAVFHAAGKKSFSIRAGTAVGWTTMARMKPEVTVEQARADLNSIMRTLIHEYPDDYPQDASCPITPLRDASVGRGEVDALDRACVRDVRAADRGGECGESLAGAGDGARERICDPIRTGQRQRPHCPAVAHRVASARASVRLGWNAACLLGNLCTSAHCAPRDPASGRDSRSIPPFSSLGLASAWSPAYFLAWPLRCALHGPILSMPSNNLVQPGFRVRPFETPRSACGQPNRAGVRLGHRNRLAFEKPVPPHQRRPWVRFPQCPFALDGCVWQSLSRLGHDHDYYRQVREEVRAIPGVEGVAMAQDFPFSRPSLTPFHIRGAAVTERVDAPVSEQLSGVTRILPGA